MKLHLLAVVTMYVSTPVFVIAKELPNSMALDQRVGNEAIFSDNAELALKITTENEAVEKFGLKILNTIGELNMTAPLKHISEVSFESEGFLSYPSNNSEYKLFISSIGGTVLNKSEMKADSHNSKVISFMGIIDLLRVTDNSKWNRNNSIELLIDVKFYGDWQRMAVGKSLAYVSKTLVGEGDVNQVRETHKILTICQVKKSLPASDLHPNLQGAAKELHCKVSGAKQKFKITSIEYFLEDYSYWFNGEVLLNSKTFSKQRIKNFKTL